MGRAKRPRRGAGAGGAGPSSAAKRGEAAAAAAAVAGPGAAPRARRGAKPPPAGGGELLERLREEMRKAGPGVDAYVVPSEDPHQSEYSAACYARREFLSGFTGSAGTAVVTKDSALLWTDGRYFLQAEQELGPEWQLMRAGLAETPDIGDFLKEHLGPAGRVGIDPMLHTAENAKKLAETLTGGGLELVAVKPGNLVDKVWGAARPAEPRGAVRVHPLEYAGEDVLSKLGKLRAEMAKQGADALVVSMLDEVAWAFNIRGCDVEFNPVTIAYGLVTKDAANLYIEKAKLSGEVRAHLKAAGVGVKPYAEMEGDIQRLAGSGQTFMIDPARVSFGLTSAIEEASRAPPPPKPKGRKRKSEAAASASAKAPAKPIVESTSPVVVAKAVKNAAELEGMREAHIRDGAALAAFFHWVEGVVGNETLTEVDVDRKLIEFRGQQEGFIEPSFPTIAGEGPNGAIIHYRPAEGTCREISGKSMLLIDSGAQYDCGTTDVTRTVHFGEPSDHQKECFTRVLKGHISLATSRFPEKTSGFALDSFARRALWDYGLDYRHGTGHGVGAALNVHEGPHGISPRATSKAGLVPGMITSNEPGYYEDGSFGIRIENLEEILEVETAFRYGGLAYLGMRALTMVPIQQKLIKVSILTEDEIAWLNAYHARVLELVGPRAEGDVKRWLEANTAKIE